MLRQRVSGDLLQTSAILTRDFTPLSAVNDANDYAGPGTGYRPSGERWEEMKQLRHVTSASNPEQEVELMATRIGQRAGRAHRSSCTENGAGPARGRATDEVVIARLAGVRRLLHQDHRRGSRTRR